MINELRQFLLVAEHGTFTEAARRTHLSQPALTAAMRRLEEQIGARLFDRDRSGARLTAEGEALLPRARAAIAAFEDGIRAVSEVSGLLAGVVRVGAGGTACTYFLPTVLAEFHRRHPEIRIELREQGTEEALKDLSAGAIDLAIVGLAQGEPWHDDELILVAAPGYERDPMSFVTFREGATSRRLLDQHFPGVDIVMELGSIASVRAHVRAGIGVTLISRATVERDLEEGSLVEVQDARTPIARPLHLVHRGVEHMPPAAAALRALLLESIPNAQPRKAGKSSKKA